MKVRKILKWIGISVAGLFGVVLLAVGVIYFFIGNDFERTFDVGLTDIEIPSDEASITEGRRLAQLRGCFSGCHGDETEGAVFFEVPDGTRMIAPDLGLAATKYSAAELERIIRHGVRPDGTSVLIPMPSEMFAHLNDADLAAIISFLQSQAPGEESLPDSNYGPIARVMLLLFKQDADTILAADVIDHGNTRMVPSSDNIEEFGRYLAMTTCSECHGNDLRGFPEFDTPPLSIVAAYSVEDFSTLMQTGVPIGGRELELMAEVAVERFSQFTGREVAALHTYLSTLVDN